MTQADVTITTREVARLAHVDSSTVRRWVDRGQLTPTVVTPGGHYRFNEESVRQQLSHQPAGAA